MAAAEAAIMAGIFTPIHPKTARLKTAPPFPAPLESLFIFSVVFEPIFLAPPLAESLLGIDSFVSLILSSAFTFFGLPVSGSTSELFLPIPPFLLKLNTRNSLLVMYFPVHARKRILIAPPRPTTL